MAGGDGATVVTPSARGQQRPPARRVADGAVHFWVTEHNAAVTAATDLARADTRARVEQAALDLFTLRGFDPVTIDDVAAASGISRRTFFRYFATKADAVWGDFDAHVAQLECLLAATDPAQSVLASVCGAYVEVNDYADADLPLLRERMQLILTEPALLAHSQLRYAAVDRVVAEHVARRTGSSPTDLVPRLVAASTRAAATTAFELWLADGKIPLGQRLREAFTQLTDGFPALAP
jgi:TetR/AcrR family transcriptional regulator, regulator of mycofactocin system